MTMMIDFAPVGPATLSRGRPTKFTPERIQQICNLVERGKSRDEIAEIIGVTTGTLQVTCSKLGISLRRPRFNIGTGLLPKHLKNGYSGKGSERSGETTMPDAVFSGTRCPSGSPEETNGKDGARIAIQIQHKGQERLTDVPLDQSMIGQLALEAEIKGMRTGELIGALVLEVIRNDLFHLVKYEVRHDN
jgi:hypothetical protein